MNTKLARLLANPQLNVWGFIIGIVGLLFAFYTYWDSQSFPNLIAQVHPSRTILVSPEGVQDLTVYANGKFIQGPVTSVQIAIWNAGAKPIRAEDVLENIQIKTDKPTPILSVRVLQVTRALTNIETDITKSSSGIVGIKFKILEKNDAALLQITYEGDDKINFIGSGSIVGQRKFEVTRFPKDDKNEKPVHASSTENKILIISLIVFLIFFLPRIITQAYKDAVRIIKTLKNPNEDKKTKFISITELVFGIVAIIVFGYLMFNTISAIPTTVSPYLSN